jgi:hypothetical protein
MSWGGEHGVRISLSAVVMALQGGTLCVLTTEDPDHALSLPSGPFDPVDDRTFERALRAFVTAQTGFGLGFVEQLYTFGDAGREAPRATRGPDRRREISVGYLALTDDAVDMAPPGARWIPVLDIFPWEDQRAGPSKPVPAIITALQTWSAGEPSRVARIEALFPSLPSGRWDENRVLERYELLYEAGLVSESARDRDRAPDGLVALADRPMASDHRRILATGLGRLRSKLRYRPVLFQLTPPTFTLSALQAAAEAVVGLKLHKQNFRRGVERTGLVEPTGEVSTGTGGRPAELFRYTGAGPIDGQAPGLALPTLR